jgi:hypothetical protein
MTLTTLHLVLQFGNHLLSVTENLNLPSKRRAPALQSIACVDVSAVAPSEKAIAQGKGGKTWIVSRKQLLWRFIKSDGGWYCLG